MKKSLWMIVLLVIVSILLSLRVFTPLTKADDSLLSQAIEKTQLNTETSDDLMEIVLAQERHFVEVSFIVITVFMVVLFGSFALFNYQGTRSQLRWIEEKLRKEYTEKSDSLETGIRLNAAAGFSIQATILEKSKPEISLVLYWTALNGLTKCPIENKEVQELITDALNRMYKLAPKVSLPDETRKSIEDTLNELSNKHPLLKEKIEEIKKKLEIK